MRGAAIHQEDEGFDNGLTKMREKMHADHYSDRAAKEAEFRLVRRLRFIKPGQVTPFDRVGGCAMCKDSIVYDAKVSEGKAHICIPCGLRLFKSGMKELAALGSWEPTDTDVDDDEMMRRLEANVQENRRGAVDPKHVLPGNKGLPKHKMRGKDNR